MLRFGMVLSLSEGVGRKDGEDEEVDGNSELRLSTPTAAGLFLLFRHRGTERAFSGIRALDAPSRKLPRIPVIKPYASGIKSGSIEGDIWRQVKG
ncbi:MAG: hypothetical protein F4Y62_06875 [Rhodospirillaceae bacterium]|nr:hypothetical protein [Rhodospirillaceae bacterium]